jgi:large subunit ribosomal protein L1
MSTGKKQTDARAKYDRETLYPPVKAIGLSKDLSTAKFDETVELSVRLGVDPRKADQIVRGTVSLPGGTGQNVRVAVFADGPAATEAREAGADVVGGEDLVERVQGGFLDFDVAIATPDMMGQVGKVARILGPRKLMPNPKTGTVTTDVGKAVGEFKGGRVEYRTDKVGNIHVPIGKVSFERQALVDNFRAVIDELQRAKPASAKGRYVRSVTVSSTMGPGVKIDPNLLKVTEEELAAELAEASA